MFAELWDMVSEIRVPLLLARGMLQQSVVDDEDEAELLRRLPTPGWFTSTRPATASRATCRWSWPRAIEAFVFE